MCYLYDSLDISVRSSALNGAEKSMTPSSLSPSLHILPQPETSRTRERASMFDTMRSGLNWAYTAKNVYKTVRICCSCARNRASLKMRHLNFSLPMGPTHLLPGIYCSQVQNYKWKSVYHLQNWSMSEDNSGYPIMKALLCMWRPSSPSTRR